MLSLLFMYYIINYLYNSVVIDEDSSASDYNTFHCIDLTRNQEEQGVVRTDSN